MRHLKNVFIYILWIVVFTQISVPGYSQVSKNQSPGNLIDHTYDLMTFVAGDLPDWDAIKDLFHEDAVIVLRTSRTDITLMDRDGFIDLWLRDYEKGLKESGITEEKIIDRYEIIGDIAVCYVIYAVSLPDRDYPPQYGIDCFHLLNQNDRWYITSIVNEVLRPGVDPPRDMKEEFAKYLDR